MRRALQASTFACLLLVSAAAGAQTGAPDATSPTNPAETACIAQSIGSACDSSTTTAGGTCLAGCCCHYVTDPEGAVACAPCLACSDTAGSDPAFKAGACSDGGTLVSEDSGTVTPIYDGGGTTVGTPPPSPAPTSSGGGGCSVVPRETSSVGGMLLALGVVCVSWMRAAVRRKRSPLRLQRRARPRVQDSTSYPALQCPTTRSRTSSSSSSSPSGSPTDDRWRTRSAR